MCSHHKLQRGGDWADTKSYNKLQMGDDIESNFQPHS